MTKIQCFNTNQINGLSISVNTPNRQIDYLHRKFNSDNNINNRMWKNLHYYYDQSYPILSYHHQKYKNIICKMYDFSIFQMKYGNNEKEFSCASMLTTMKIKVPNPYM